jgi:hypothetical protein
VKTFRSLVGLRMTPGPVATAIRDRLAEIAPALENVESITTVARVDRADGGVALVNAWRVNPDLPAALSALITPEQMGWLDHAEWSADLAACRWRIEPLFMKEAIACAGETRFETAMGGRGTRAIFEGRLDIDPVALSSIPAIWRGPASAAVELLVGTLIPQNFRRTVEAIAALLNQERSADEGAVVETQPRIGGR